MRQKEMDEGRDKEGGGREKECDSINGRWRYSSWTVSSLVSVASSNN